MRIAALYEFYDLRRRFVRPARHRSESGCLLRMGVAYLHAAGLGLGQRIFGTPAGQFAFMLRHGGKDVEHQAVRFGHVDGDEVLAALHQRADEGDVTGQPVQVGDQQRGAAPAAFGEGGRQLGPVRVALAALNLRVLRQQLAATVHEACDVGSLGIKAQAAAALALRRHAIIGDVGGHCEESKPFGSSLYSAICPFCLSSGIPRTAGVKGVPYGAVRPYLPRCYFRKLAVQHRHGAHQQAQQLRQLRRRRYGARLQRRDDSLQRCKVIGDGCRTIHECGPDRRQRLHMQ